jgi:molybdopterin molybdotransferase
MDDLRKKPGKLNLVRVKLEQVNGGFRAYSSGVQQTALLKTMILADALAVFPSDLENMGKGATVQCHLLREELLMGEEYANSEC